MAKAGEIEGLDCRADAARGIRLVLSSRLDEMISYRDAALVAEDPEGVHDMRVASRRLRSALRDFAPHMNEKRVAGVRVELEKLADALGRVRDLDVETEALEEAAREAPKGTRAGVEARARAQRAESAQAREVLAAELDDDALARLRAEFADALTKALGAARSRRKGKGSGVGRREGSFDDVGREVIVARWEELRARASSLYRPFKTRRLHKTRISAKRLRYALELFTPCLGEELRDFAEEVKRMQKSLGEVHDCDERIKSLGGELAGREGAEGVGVAESSGAGAREERAETSAWLFDYFVERRNLHFREAFARWRAWGREGFESRLRACVGGQESEGVRAAAEDEAKEGGDGKEARKRRPGRGAKAPRGGRASPKDAS